MSRAHDGSAANSSYQWDIQVAEPTWLERVPIYHDEFPEEPRGLPDVPLNINVSTFSTSSKNDEG